MTPRDWRAIGLVFIKEWREMLRDRRTLLLTLISAVALGPLGLVVMSWQFHELEQRAQAREVRVMGVSHSPNLINYIERQGYRVLPASADDERHLREHHMEGAVLSIPKAFELALVRGEQPTVTLLHSGDVRGRVEARQVQALVQGFNREQTVLRLALRGVSLSVTEAIHIETHEEPEVGGGANASMSAMLPFFVLMAMLFGTMNTAVDSTAGERERGSLAPLLMSPVSHWALVIGKWGAATAQGMLIACLSCMGFLLGRWGLHSREMAQWFDYGLTEAGLFLWVLLPLAAALAAVLMAMAIRSHTVKEAQAGGALVVMVVSLLPLLGQLGGGHEQPWHWGVPGLAQATLMNRVLQGETLPLMPMLEAWVIGALLTWGALMFTVRQLRHVAGH